jgi:hypothetical protein
MSTVNVIIPISTILSAKIAKLCKKYSDKVFTLPKYLLKDIPDIPSTYSDKVHCITISTSACPDNIYTAFLGLHRVDKHNKSDIDGIGILYTDLKSPSTSACMIRHGNWDTDRTQDLNIAKEMLKTFSKDIGVNLRTSPNCLLKGHKKINELLHQNDRLINYKKSRFLK